MKNILEYFEQTCARYPEHIAAADEQHTLSFHELYEKSRRIGFVLAGFTGKRPAPVAIYIEKTPSLAAAITGVLYSGNFYAVLDTQMPPERIKKIFETLRPALVLTDKEHENKISVTGCPTLRLEDICRAEADPAVLAGIRGRMTENDPAYVLYTSGSTGSPKGAVISHRALISYTDWFIQAFDISADTVFGSQTPLYFSMSVSDFYSCLRTGARYQIIPKKYFSFPMQLIDYLNRCQINTIYWVPSALNIVANWDTFSYTKPTHLKKVLFAGEVMPVKQLNYWRRHLPDVFYANLFGPTETTDICSYYVVDREFADTDTLPIGKACDNCDLLIVDENGQESDAGELLVRSPFLSDGYYNNPEKTAEAFVQNPLNTAFPETVYRTGDLVSMAEDGLLYYQGRKDFQIKRMGYRIEPGEIEAAAGALPDVQSCVCIYKEKEDRLILLYQGKNKKDDVFQAICCRLPSYMRPDEVDRIRQMPYNANGKIDRKKLKAAL